MNTQKVAITMPKELVRIVDDLSKKNHISRSKFISTIVYERVVDEKRVDLKNAYDQVFSDNSICREQLDTARWFSNLDVSEGQEW